MAALQRTLWGVSLSTGELPMKAAGTVPSRAAGARSLFRHGGDMKELAELRRRIERIEEALGLVGDAQVEAIPATAPVVARLIDHLNRTAGRRLTPGAYAPRVRAALKAGYTEAELRLVSWWAHQQWGEDERMKKHINPDCLWKLKPGGPSNRALPQYLAEAIELYEQRSSVPFDRWRKFDA